MNLRNSDEKIKILVVDNDQDMREIVLKCLSDAGYDVYAAATGKEALSRAEEIFPDLIMLDILLPDISGIEVEAELNRNHIFANIPVIMVSSLGNLSDKIKDLSAGIDDYIAKPFNREELLLRVSSVLKRRKVYEEISMTDGLTGLYNLNYFNRQLTQLFNVATRYKSVFSLAIMDVDDLKSINDTYGHLVGNNVLQKIALILRENTRNVDIVTRYGGDEFAVLFPATDKAGVERVMERLQKKLNEESVATKEKAVKCPFSVSVGMATYDDSFNSAEQLFEEADSNMYKHKKAKRGSK